MRSFDETLFIESLYDTYSLNVKAMAKYILKDEKLAEKAVYSTYKKVIFHRKFLCQAESDEVGKLIVVFLRCACFEILRKKNDIKYYSKVEIPEYSDNQGNLDKIIKKSTLRWLKNTLTSFGSPFKEICILKFYYNLDLKTVSRTLGMSKLDVFSVLSRRLAQLKSETEGFIGDSVAPKDLGLAVALVSGEYAGEEFCRMEKFDIAKVKISPKTKTKVLNTLKFSRMKPFIILGSIAVLVPVSVIIILTSL